MLEVGAVVAGAGEGVAGALPDVVPVAAAGAGAEGVCAAAAGAGVEGAFGATGAALGYG